MCRRAPQRIDFRHPPPSNPSLRLSLQKPLDLIDALLHQIAVLIRRRSCARAELSARSLEALRRSCGGLRFGAEHLRQERLDKLVRPQPPFCRGDAPRAVASRLQRRLGAAMHRITGAPRGDSKLWEKEREGRHGPKAGRTGQAGARLAAKRTEQVGETARWLVPRGQIGRINIRQPASRSALAS